MAHIITGTNGETRGPLLIQVSVAIYAAAFIFVASRFLARGWLIKKFGLDDILIAVAMCLGAVQTATITLQVKHGRGRHASELSVEQYNDMLLYTWINMLVYYGANWTVKMSILALYHRIGTSLKGLPWVLRSRMIWAMAGIITAFTVAIFFIGMFACMPVWRFWDVEHNRNSCMLMASFNMAQGAINVSIDLMLLIFPLPLLRTLKINTKQRSALIVIFSIGVIPLIASVMRLCKIVLAFTPTGISWQDGDTSWTWAWVPVWSQIEVDAGIVAASLPSLSPLLKKVWSSFGAQQHITLTQFPTLAKPAESQGGFRQLQNHSDVSLQEAKDTKRRIFHDDQPEDEDEFDYEAFPVCTVETEVRIAQATHTKVDLNRPSPDECL